MSIFRYDEKETVDGFAMNNNETDPKTIDRQRYKEFWIFFKTAGISSQGNRLMTVQHYYSTQDCDDH